MKLYKMYNRMLKLNDNNELEIHRQYNTDNNASHNYNKQNNYNQKNHTIWYKWYKDFSWVYKIEDIQNGAIW